MSDQGRYQKLALHDIHDLSGFHYLLNNKQGTEETLKVTHFRNMILKHPRYCQRMLCILLCNDC